uniref:Prolyl endopeptidase n=1 Tax=Parastrongyloides trichosuri TaxID=131310 RepID=A0A0N4ZLP4_PARTI
MIVIHPGGRLETEHYPDIYRNESEGETFFNITFVGDPYRYLDNVTHQNTTEFITKLNNISQTFFTNASKYSEIKEKVEKYISYERYDVFGKHGKYYYYLYNNGSQENDVLMRTEDYKNRTNATKFVDPNELGKNGEYSVTTAAFSPDGEIVAYGVSANGSDFNTIYFKYQNGTNLTDKIEHVIYSEITFVLNGTGFIYSKYPDTNVSEDGEIETYYENHTLYFHKMGNNQTQDVAIVNSSKPNDVIDGSESKNGKYLFATYWTGASDATYIKYYNISNYNVDNFTEILNMTSLFENENGENYEVLYSNDTHALIKTDKNASFGKVIEVDFSGNRNTTLIAERNGSKLQSAWIQSAWAVGKEFLILNYLENVISRLYVYSRLNGSLIQTLNILDLNGTVKQHFASIESNETFFEFENEITPKTIFRVDLTNATNSTPVSVEKVAEPVIEGFNSSDFVVKQVFYPSDDHVNVSMFILSRKDIKMDNSSPAILEVYGGFSIPVLPHFSSSKMMFVKHFHGISCIANVRGGNEFGEKWHEDGMLLNKQNTFNDTARAAVYLFWNNYTNPQKLAIIGGSNGGLAAAVVAQQHPEVLKSVVLRGAVLDMIYYKNYTVGKTWVDEYGDPDSNETVFNYLYKYSPLHNIRVNATNETRGREWPSTVLYTSVDDYRVPAGHTLKYIAELYHTVKKNASKFQTVPLLAYVENGTGHGNMKSTSKAAEEISNIYSFLYQTLNMTFYDDVNNTSNTIKIKRN